MTRTNNVINNVRVALFVLLIGGVVFFGHALTVSAATLSVSPSTGVYTEGQTFTVRVNVNTAGEAINAAEGTLSFDPRKLSVVGISKGSVFNLWTAEPSFSNSKGTVSFSGGSPAGYRGGAGTILTVTFRSQGSGTNKISYTSGSVLAADGRGTNVLSSMAGGSYTIAAATVTPEPEVIEYIAAANTPGMPEITSRTHNDPAGWYQSEKAELSWSLPAGVTAVRTLLDSNAGSIPTKVYETPIDSITLEDLEDGEQYFHIQFRNESGWGRVAHYRLAVDTTAPENFSVALAENADLSNPEQVLVASFEDGGSPITRYLVQIDGGEPFEYIDEAASGTVRLPALDPGHHSIVVEAFDAASNSSISSVSFAVLAFEKPTFTEFPLEIGTDVIPVLKGVTRPSAEVVVSVLRVGAGLESAYVAEEYRTTSDEGGVFAFVPDGRFAAGTYEISAYAIDEYGAKSDLSDILRIAVQEPGHVRIGAFVVSILSIAVPILAILILLVLMIGYLWRRIASTRTFVRKETREALDLLTKEFAALRAALMADKEKLAESRRTKKLTKAEEELVSHLEESLRKSEGRIRKEIDDVDNI